jgi:hypothetical protein
MGIAQTPLVSQLEITHAGTNTPVNQIELNTSNVTDGGGSGIFFKNSGATGSSHTNRYGTRLHTIRGNNGASTFVISNEATNGGGLVEAFRIDTEHRITKPKTPHFAANASPTIGSSSDLYVARSFGNVPHNVGSHYNNSNGRFTAPIAGTYLFGSALWCSNSDQNSGQHLLVFRKNGSESGFGCNHRTYQNQLHATMCITLAANDYVTTGFASGSGGSVQGSTPRNYFWGYLVG